MKGKKLVWVLLALVLCLAVYFAVKRIDFDKKEETGTETVYINQMEAGDITGFSFVSGTETLSFARDGDVWYNTGNDAAEMNQTSMASMADMLAEIPALESFSDYERLSDYGLDTPSNTITITTREGTKELLIGNENKAAGGYYAMVNGADTVYLISSSLPEKFSCTLDTLTETKAEISEETTEGTED